MPCLTHGALNKTYPTAAVTNIRIETYLDGFSTMYDSTWTVSQSSWTPVVLTTGIIPTQIWLPPQDLNIYYLTLHGSTWTVSASTISIQDYNALLIENVKYQILNKIMDDDTEEYCVYPSSVAPDGWKGWCQQIINGHSVPIPCP